MGLSRTEGRVMDEPVFVSRVQWVIPLLLLALALVATWLIAPGNWAAFLIVGGIGVLLNGILGVKRTIQWLGNQRRSQ